MMQSQSDREFQRNVMNFKKTLKDKTTWEDFEEYVGHKMEEGDKLKGFILDYFNRDFEQLYDDGQRYITTKIICKRDAQGYMKVLNSETNKETIRQRKAQYRETNKDAIKQQRADYYKLNKESRKFYCDICEIVCGTNHDLQQHLRTKKHSKKSKNVKELFQKNKYKK